MQRARLLCTAAYISAYFASHVSKNNSYLTLASLDHFVPFISSAHCSVLSNLFGSVTIPSQSRAILQPRSLALSQSRTLTISQSRNLSRLPTIVFCAVSHFTSYARKSLVYARLNESQSVVSYNNISFASCSVPSVMFRSVFLSLHHVRFARFLPV